MHYISLSLFFGRLIQEMNLKDTAINTQDRYRHVLRETVEHKGKIHGKLNASWKISSLAVNGQSFLVIDGYLLDFQ